MNPRPAPALLLASAFLAGVAAPLAEGHPLGNFSISHYTRFHVTAGGVQVVYSLDFAEIPTQQLQREWGSLTQERADQAMSQWIAKGLHFRAGSVTLVPLHEGTEIEVGSGEGAAPIVRVTGLLRLPAAPGQLDYEDRNFAGRAGWKEIVISEEAPAYVTRASHSRRDMSRGLTRYPLEVTTPPHDLRAHLEWNLQAPASASPRIVTPIPQPDPAAVDAAPSPARGQDRLSLLLRQPHLDPPLAALALALAFGLGALHALEPGHGKTIVAAYLVGTRGTWRHALYLGAIVTFTHTFSVFVLGLLTLFATNFWPPETIFPVLGAVSGLSIFALGLWLLWQRWHGAPPHIHGPGGHTHAPGQPHHHEHEPLPERVTWGNLLALGISGGIVPCPAAMVLLLGCVGMGRVALGLGLLAAFSLGLAIVLTAIGLLVIYAKARMPGRTRVRGWAEYLPILSALVITIIGAVLTGRALGWV